MADLCPPPALLPTPPATGASALSCRAAPALPDATEADWLLQLLSDAAAEQPVAPPVRATPSAPSRFEHPMAAHAPRSGLASLPHPHSHPHPHHPHLVPGAPIAPDALRVPHQRRLRCVATAPRQSRTSMVPLTGRVFGRRIPPAARGIDDWWLDPTIRQGKELFLDPATGQVAYFPLAPTDDGSLCDSWSALLWSCVPIPPMPPVPDFLSPLKTHVSNLLPPLLWGPSAPAPEPKAAALCTPAILITPPDTSGAQHITPSQDRSGSTLAVPSMC